MNILELQEKRMNLQDELTSLINESETRSLEDNETGRLAEIRTEIDGIDAQITAIEAENRKLAKETETKNNTEIKKENKMEVRLFDLIKGVAEGNVTDEMRAYVTGNKINYRAINVSNATQGQENVPEDKKALDIAIRNASILNKIGATWFSNAVGDISIPKYAGSTVGWKGELASADNGEGAFSEVNLTPKRLTAYIDISKTFLAQDANSAEALLIADLAKAISEKLDKTVFGAESGTTERPEGLFNITGITTTGTSLSSADYDDILALESKVEEKNGTDFIFIANPKVKYQYKGVQMANGLNMVFNGGEIDGYKTVVSNSVVSKGIVCMDPRDLAVATWSGIEITVDTVSQAIDNKVRIVVNYLVDAKLRGDRIAAELFS